MVCCQGLQAEVNPGKCRRGSWGGRLEWGVASNNVRDGFVAQIEKTDECGELAELKDEQPRSYNPTHAETATGPLMRGLNKVTLRNDTLTPGARR